MTLALLSNLPLSDLKNLAETYFGDIQSSEPVNLEIQKIIPFPVSKRRKMFHIVAHDSSNLLKINWITEDPREYYKTKPLYYISYLLGHEGKGSLLSFLRDEDLATSIISYDDSKQCNTVFLGLSIELTLKGLQNIDYIIS